MNECSNLSFWAWEGWDGICKEILWALILKDDFQFTVLGNESIREETVRAIICHGKEHGTGVSTYIDVGQEG